LHAIIVIITIAIPYSLPSCLIWFPFSHTHAFRSLLRVLYALSTVHDTSSKNAELSSATVSFPWRQKTSKYHGYNAVADFLRNAKLSSATTSFPWPHTNNSNNHGYNAVADELRRQPFRTENSALAHDDKGKKDKKGQTFSSPYIPYGLFQIKGKMSAKFSLDWFRNVNLYKVQTNKQTNI
jgi:hypothetical protein